LEWEQEDDYTGLQQGSRAEWPAATRATRSGKRFVMEPGVYGEHMVVDEKEMTVRRKWGDLTDASIDISIWL